MKKSGIPWIRQLLWNFISAVINQFSCSQTKCLKIHNNKQINNNNNNTQINKNICSSVMHEIICRKSGVLKQYNRNTEINNNNNNNNNRFISLSNDVLTSNTLFVAMLSTSMQPPLSLIFQMPRPTVYITWTCHFNNKQLRGYIN